MNRRPRSLFHARRRGQALYVGPESAGKEVTEATAEYRAEQDVLGEFLASECLILPEARARASELIDRSQRYTGEKVNLNKFGRSLVDRGFRRIPNNGIWYSGIGLRPDDDARNKARNDGRF